MDAGGIHPGVRNSIAVSHSSARRPTILLFRNSPAFSEERLLLLRENSGILERSILSFDKKRYLGLTHTSKLDRQVWDEFHADWNGLVWVGQRDSRVRSGIAVESRTSFSAAIRAF